MRMGNVWPFRWIYGKSNKIPNCFFNVSRIMHIHQSEIQNGKYRITKRAAADICRRRRFVCLIIPFYTAHYLCSIFLSVANDSQLKPVYWNAEEKSRKFTKLIFSGVVVYNQSSYAIGFFYSIYFILTGQYDTSTWPMFYDLPVPFNRELIWGWYLYLLALTIFDLLYILCMTSVSTYFVSCCYYIEAMCNHINSVVRSVLLDFAEHSNENDSNKRKALEDAIPKKVQSAIVQLIHTHIEINKWVQFPPARMMHFQHCIRFKFGFHCLILISV